MTDAEREAQRKITLGKKLAKLEDYQRDKWVPLIVDYFKPSIKACAVCDHKPAVLVKRGEVPRQGAMLTQAYVLVEISCSDNCWMPAITRRYFGFDMKRHKLGIIAQIKEWNDRGVLKRA